VYVLFGAGYVLLNYVVFEQLYCGGVLNLRRGMSGTLYLLLGSIDPRSRLEDESLLLKGGECHGLYLVLYFTHDCTLYCILPLALEGARTDPMFVVTARSEPSLFSRSHF
jgi:hypothetical protein